MTGERLRLALNEGLELPETGMIAVFGPRAGQDLSALPRDRLRIITGLYPDHAWFRAQGYEVDTTPQEPYAAALVCLPRAKALARGWMAAAVRLSSGLVIVDGTKGEGVESLLKACRKRVSVAAPVSKAHGKLFWFDADGDFADWAPGAPMRIEDGFVTVPGVFSADGIDPGSRLLADAMPAKLGAHIADLGGGWGYLSARALERGTIQTLDLVEADHSALDCARRNITDPRVRFCWADATRWRPDAQLDGVIMNPPFHAGRAADPALGRAFVAAAAGMLKPSGRLWLVANRHLPYETALAAHFGEVGEIGGDNRFKLLRAARPARMPR